ncbi:MAG: alpha/beta hydrolase [Dehalococcoidia bacterium]|nr:alpha/beta hydrolase [Dehalococcoidia bacterium]
MPATDASTAAAVEPKHETVTINGLNLHYVDYREPSPGATVMVLLHGLTSAWGAWRRVAEHFAPRYRVVALDQRGHGDSQWAPADEYDTDSYLSDLEQFVDGLGLERVVLVGQSMGGHHTIAYTARHAERVIAAIANDIPPSLDMGARAERAKAYPGGKHRLWASVEEWLAPRREQSPLTPEWAHALAARELLREVDGGYEPKHDPNAPIHWQPADLWDEARTITRPIFFIRGGRSTVLDAQTLQDMVMAIAPARSVTLEKAGHQTYWDMEHEWLTIADAFLQAHTR